MTLSDEIFLLKETIAYYYTFEEIINKQNPECAAQIESVKVELSKLRVQKIIEDHVMKTFKVITKEGLVFHICVPLVDAERTRQFHLQNYCEVTEVTNVCPF